VKTSWYVSHDGRGADEACGRSRYNPCHRLNYVINVAAAHDVIYIDDVGSASEGADAKRPPQSTTTTTTYRLNCAESFEGSGDGRLIKSLTIIAVGVRPRISCESIATHGLKRSIAESSGRWPNATGDVVVAAAAVTQPEVRHLCSVTIVNSTFVDVDLVFDDCNVFVQSTQFIRSTLGTTSRCRRMRLRVADSRWYGGRSTCGRSSSWGRHVEGDVESFCNGRNGSGDDVAAKPGVVDDATAAFRCSNITCSEVDVSFDRVEFVLSAVRTVSSRWARLVVNGSLFIDDIADSGSQYHGGLHLTFPAVSASIQIVDTNFTRQVDLFI